MIVTSGPTVNSLPPLMPHWWPAQDTCRCASPKRLLRSGGAACGPHLPATAPRARAQPSRRRSSAAPWRPPSRGAPRACPVSTPHPPLRTAGREDRRHTGARSGPGRAARPPGWAVGGLPHGARGRDERWMPRGVHAARPRDAAAPTASSKGGRGPFGSRVRDDGGWRIDAATTETGRAHGGWRSVGAPRRCRGRGTAPRWG